MLFDAQKAGNRISELLDFKFFWGGWGGHTPLVVTAAYYTFSGHLELMLLKPLLWHPDDVECNLLLSLIFVLRIFPQTLPKEIWIYKFLRYKEKIKT